MTQPAQLAFPDDLCHRRCLTFLPNDVTVEPVQNGYPKYVPEAAEHKKFQPVKQILGKSPNFTAMA